MRRGSFERRLPRGRLDHKTSRALLGVAMFIIILVPSLFYLFPDSTHISTPCKPSSDQQSRLEVKSCPSSSANSHTKNPIVHLQQETARSDATLLATVYPDPEMSQVYLENTGPSELHSVQVIGEGRSLGILSLLASGEKKVLALSGSPHDLQAKALDPSGEPVSARVSYIPFAGAVASSNDSANDSKIVLRAKSVPSSDLSSFGSASSAAESSTTASSGTFSSFGSTASSTSSSEKVGAKEHESSPLHLTIAVNRSDASAGQMVSYRCTAKNIGQTELSEVRMVCAGKVASTKYLPAGEELNLDAEFPIRNTTVLHVGVQAKDASGRLYTNNSSAEVWMISPSLKIQVSLPSRVHRGEHVKMQIRLENIGSTNLSEIQVKDRSSEIGEIDRIPKLMPGSYRMLQKEIVVTHSISDAVVAIAHDDMGRDVYASQTFRMDLLNSSLKIESKQAEVQIYPGEPVEVTWILSNTGEEPLHNITLDGDESRRILKDLPAGKSVEMAAIYTKNTTIWINVTAKGTDGRGSEAFGKAGVLLQVIKPGIAVKVMPTDIEVSPGDEAEANVLVSNSGDDRLQNVVLKMNGSTIANLGDLSSGEFRVIDSRTVISDNCSIEFEAEGFDSRGQIRSDKASAKVSCVIAAIKVFASASPAAPAPGESCQITCTVANTGMVPLNGIFVISKKLGPLGNIDFLSPKRQTTVVSEKTVNEAIDDVITVEGFTQDRSSVVGSFPLSINVLGIPDMTSQASRIASTGSSEPPAVGLASANITFGNLSLPFNLPVQEQTESEVSKEMARDIDNAARKQNNIILDGIANLLAYVEKLLGLDAGQDISQDENSSSNADQFQGGNDSSSEQEASFYPKGEDALSGSRNYELSIEGVKGSEHGAISILDVNALPAQPAANEPVKVTVHLQSEQGIKSAQVKYGLSDLPLTKADMLSVDRVYDSALALESGTAQDGYWSGTIPGRGAGTYMPLSVWITDGLGTAEGGPYLMHWSTVNAAGTAKTVVASTTGGGMLFIESSSVQGTGEVSIKDTIQGSTMEVNEKVMGSGSINLETMRCVNRHGAVDNFTEKKDLVFSGGVLKGHKTVSSPTFQGGLGASVTERFNLSHVDKSETSSVSSNSYANNTLSYKTDQAFEGTWNIQTKYAKLFKKIKADQKYTGSFQTQKDIEFKDDA